MDADDQQRLATHVIRGFRDLQLRDLLHSDKCDVRMGTFIQAAAFIDALALTYSAGVKVPTDGEETQLAAKWRRFVSTYFPPNYEPVAQAYGGFRCLLLHNFTAAPTFGFTHNEQHRHLQEEDGVVILDRGSLVAAAVAAYDAFEHQVLADGELGFRALEWFEGGHAPLRFLVRRDGAPGQLALDVSQLALGAPALTGTSGLPGASLANTATTAWGRSPDRQQERPPTLAPSIKTKKRRKRSN